MFPCLLGTSGIVCGSPEMRIGLMDPQWSTRRNCPPLSPCCGLLSAFNSATVLVMSLSSCSYLVESSDTCQKRTSLSSTSSTNSLYGIRVLGEPVDHLHWLLLPVQSKPLCWYCFVMPHFVVWCCKYSVLVLPCTLISFIS